MKVRLCKLWCVLALRFCVCSSPLSAQNVWTPGAITWCDASRSSGCVQWILWENDAGAFTGAWCAGPFRFARADWQIWAYEADGTRRSLLRETARRPAAPRLSSQ
jgi:hypothetical protein